MNPILRAARPLAPRRRAAFALMAGMVGTATLAQTVPGAGQLLEETRRNNAPTLPTAPLPRLIEPPVRPTVTMPEGMTVAVSGFRISGAASYPDATLSDLVKPWLGRRLDIAGLNEAAGAITRFYQSNGHVLSYAYLPAQRVADGVIELAVLEGRLDGVQIVAAQDVRLRDEVVQAHAERLQVPGPVLETAVERQMLLLNDIPGVAARAAFTPGASTGTADLVVSVAEDEPIEARAQFNNHGTKSTGVFRAGFDVQLRDAFGWGDSITARALTSERGGLVNGSLSATLPVGGAGLRLGASLSHLTYQLGDDFKRLGAVGSADVVGIDASYALRRTMDSNIGLRASLEHRVLNDELQLLATATHKRSDVLEFSVSSDSRSGESATAGSATLSLGQMTQASGRNEWRKLGAQLARQQSLSGPWSLYARVALQGTDDNLDSSEKLGLGGPGAVRAYASGEAAVDIGVLASLELRYGLDLRGGGVVVSLFHDAANGRISRYPLVADGNQVKLSGTGVGLSWNGGGVGVSASLAWRGSRAPTADSSDPQPRLFLQMSVSP